MKDFIYFKKIEGSMIKIKLILYENGKGPRTVLSDLTLGDKLLVGRGQNVQLWVNDKNISREHSALLYENNGIYITDLGSRNGTYVNDERIEEKRKLNEGDEIRLASTSYMNIYFDYGEITSRNVLEQAASLPRRSVVDKGGITFQDLPASPLQFPLQAKRGLSLVGVEFKGYQIEERIGSGNVAVVYRGTHLALNRPVAVKTLSQRMLQSPTAIQRFLNVAKVSSQLTHPNIVQIYDSGLLEEYGIYYIVMEYVEGQSLSSLLQEKKRFPIDVACTIMEYLAGALTYANKKKIIHRDINPSNILIGKDNIPKLIGLGLSKSLDNELISLTQPGKGMGMVGYISPEQLSDATKADYRSDIYSMGATFYHLLCGQTPYDTKNMRDYFECIQKKIAPPPPHEVNNEVPRFISDMILKTLDFNPDKRYQTADEFVSDLRTYQALNDVHEEGIERARQQRRAMLPVLKNTKDFQFEKIDMQLLEGLGGDFYDYIPLNHDEFAVVMADITGHGVEAAVVVGMVKAAIQIISKQKSSTAEILKEVNRELLPCLDRTTFATVFHSIINRKTKKMRFSRAGHNPLILYNQNRKPSFQVFNPKGSVLGMFKECICDEQEIQLIKGDILIQYTDGISEVMNSEREEFGLERLYEVVKSVGDSGDLQYILHSLVDAAKQFRGAEEQQDDLTLLGIKVLS